MSDMTKNEVKQGDYVRMKSSGDICQIMCVGEKQTVLGLVGSQKCAFTSTVNNVERIDVKTAFLTELQALLRKHDASIGYFIGEDDKYGWSDYPILKIGNEVIKYPAGEIDEITADNIMDFDKSEYFHSHPQF